MSVNVTDFDSLEEIDKFYSKKIRLAEDEEIPRLEREQSDTKLAFRERDLLNQRLALAKQQALAEYPHAKDFEMFLTGTTPEAITEQAKALHEQQEKRLVEAADKAREEVAPAAARAQYGNPASAGSGNPVPNNQPDPLEENKQRVWGKLQRGDAPAKSDVYTFTGTRIREAVEQSRSDPSFRYTEERPGSKVEDARRKKG